MKRIQLFEFEDLPWFPDSLRACMTRMISVLHRWMGTKDHIAELLETTLVTTGRQHIVDLCSGDGGLMLDVFNKLQRSASGPNLRLTLTDLYPNRASIARVDSMANQRVEYISEPIDATGDLPMSGDCIRTLTCSFHHLPPEVAKQVLAGASQAGDPILIYEISDNSAAPKLLWWIGMPINFILGLVVAGFTRPMTWIQFGFSFLLPIIPACFAWDGAVSNARTYTQADLETLLKEVRREGYQWKIGLVEARPAKHLFLLGMPVESRELGGKSD